MAGVATLYYCFWYHYNTYYYSSKKQKKLINPSTGSGQEFSPKLKNLTKSRAPVPEYEVKKTKLWKNKKQYKLI